MGLLETLKNTTAPYNSRKTKDNPVLLSVSDKNPPPNYDWRARTKVLIHGYAGNADFNGTALVRKGSNFCIK